MSVGMADKPLAEMSTRELLDVVYHEILHDRALTSYWERIDLKMQAFGYALSLERRGDTWVAIYASEHRTGPRVVSKFLIRAVCEAALGAIRKGEG